MASWLSAHVLIVAGVLPLRLPSRNMGELAVRGLGPWNFTALGRSIHCLHRRQNGSVVGGAPWRVRSTSL